MLRPVDDVSRAIQATPRRSSANALPDTLLPVQTGGAAWGESITQPERMLMLAVLEEAVDTYCKHVRPANRRGARLFHEAETWCQSDDVHWPYSFVNICHALGLDVDYLRSGLDRWRRHALHAA
jgi:hypothetical protein